MEGRCCGLTSLYYGICWEGLGKTTIIVSPYSWCLVSDLNVESVIYEGGVLTTLTKCSVTADYFGALQENS
jgi:hypothetical protein